MHEEGKTQVYFEVGKRALEICAPYLDPRQNPRILDFPCGYGRVMRYFRNFYPNAEIFGCELDSRMLDFCEENFNSHRIQADDNLNVDLPTDLDLIFSGSLLTHFDEHQWDKFFSICEPSLKIGGHLIFTTHGRIHAKMASIQHPLFGNLIDTKALYSDYLKTGFSFLPYDPKWPTFGLSLSSPQKVMEKISKLSNLKLVHMGEGEWGQDVWVVQRIEHSLI